MEIIQPGTKIDFVSQTRNALIASGLLVVGSLIVLAVRGPNYGIDFTGGTVVQVAFNEVTSMADVRGALAPIGMQDATIQDFTDSFGTAGMDRRRSEFLVRLPVAEESLGEASNEIASALAAKFGEDAFEVLRVEIVGPRVGAALRSQALLAVLFATLMMGVYIWFRFELRFGIGAYAALAHDVIITVGALALFAYEIDLTIVAALLTVIGYSVNDTVIISDRIRENMNKFRKQPLRQLINLSINETLSRTIITSGTALMVIAALFFLGGNVIHGFAFTLLIGFIVGVYSSVFIAGPIVLWFEASGSSKPRTAAATANPGGATRTTA